MKRVHTARRLSAYTLIEMLMVIGMLGLAAGLLVPLIGQPDTLRIQAAVRQIIGDLSFAQSDALAQQAARRVHFYEDGNGYCILQSPYDPDEDFIYDPLAGSGSDGGYIVNFATDPRFEGIMIESIEIDGEARSITYDELGGTITEEGTPGTGGTIVVETANARYQITIAPFTGKMTVQEL